MNVKGWLAAMLVLVSANTANAQGFAGLGTSADGFAIPDPETRLDFPSDHGSHPDYRIEWWYLTANLKGPDGGDYGVQWTLFRSALRPGDSTGWSSPQLWMGHAAATSATGHYVAERIARGGIGQAGVTTAPFQAWIDDWSMTSIAELGTDPLSRLTLRARGAAFSYDMELAADGPLVLHGAAGYSVKSPDGQASYYYSQPAYRISGTLSLPQGDIPVTGHAWLDREWSSQPLSEDQTGWDWFSLSLDQGDKVMGFRLRGTAQDFTSATWIRADGTVRALPDGALQVVPGRIARVAGRDIPVTWQFRLPAAGIDAEVRALNPDSWMETSFPYWEGPVTVSGSHTGTGYLEMTGY